MLEIHQISNIRVLFAALSTVCETVVANKQVVENKRYHQKMQEAPKTRFFISKAVHHVWLL